MIELFRFEYYRLFKSKVVWLLVAFAALVPILAAAGMQFILVELGAEGEIDEIIESVSQVRFFTWYCISYFYERLPLVLALFVPLFIGRDYKDGVIRNKLISGHTRMEIFASTIIVQASLAVVLSVIYVLVGIVAMACTSFGVEQGRDVWKSIYAPPVIGCNYSSVRCNLSSYQEPCRYSRYLYRFRILIRYVLLAVDKLCLQQQDGS